MKLLVVHNRYRSSSPSGEDRVVDQEREALIAAGHDVRRFERFSDDITAFSLPQKAQLPVRLLWSRRAANDLDAVLETFRPDAVHFHNLFPLLSPSVLRLCERKRVPSVVTLHNYWQVCGGCTLFRTGAECRVCVGRKLPLPGIQHGCYRNSTLATLPIAVATVAHRRIWQTVPDAYIFLSDAQRQELEPVGLPQSRSFVKPNLTPPTPHRTTPEDLVVYLGRLSEPKGLLVLMRAWDRYIGARRSTGLRLAIAGTGPLEAEIRAWAASRPSVDMLGLLDRDQCASLVRRATTVVAPSEWMEPFGLVVVEAMAAGVAPIATTQGAFPDLITDGVDGLLYPPSDDGALAGLLTQIEASPQWVASLGTGARQTYERRFVPAQNVTELEAIYRFAVEHPRWLDEQTPPLMAEHAAGNPSDPGPG
jgi:glycosyltransferase involved in cell wall biosynthesis